MSAAVTFESLPETSWRVMREGNVVTNIALRHDHGAVVVSTGKKAYDFATMEAADSFVSDLMTSFSYLGCDVVQA
jgi:hypothetical protein